MSSKGTVRTEMRRLRQGLAPADREDRSRRIVERLCQVEAFRRAHRVLFYVAQGGEVETRPLIERWVAKGRKIILPRVKGDGMVLVEVERLEDLGPGYRGILEPKPDTGRRVSSEEVEVALVPGLAFDLEGNRLGRGGGHYDRVLAGIGPGALKIGLAFDFQIVERLPAEAQDIPVEIVVTETRVISVGRTTEGPMAGPLRR